MDARLLLKAHLGKLESSEFERRMRVVRVLPDGAQLSDDGRWLHLDGELRSLAADLPDSVDDLSEKKWTFDSASGRLANWSGPAGWMSIRTGDGEIAGWRFEEKLGNPRNLGDGGRVLAFSKGLVETSSGRVLWYWPKGFRCDALASDNSRVLLSTAEAYEIWDYQKQERLATLPSPGRSTRFTALIPSDDLKAIFWQTDSQLRLIEDGRLKECYPPAEENVVSRDGRTVLQVDKKKVRWGQNTLPLTPHQPVLSRNGQWVAWILEDEVEIRRSADGALIARGGRPYNHRASFDRGGKWFWSVNYEGTVVSEITPSPAVLPPAEHEQLFAELWTGKRWRAGLAREMSPEDYEKRRQEWRRLGGSDWVVSANWKAPPEPESVVPWQVWLTIPLFLWWRLQAGRSEKGVPSWTS